MEDSDYFMPMPDEEMIANAFEAARRYTASGTKQAAAKWHLIDWQRATRIVKQLQTRIVKAVKMQKWKRVRSLQRLLTHSTSAKVLAIRRVSENIGSRTAGIDGEKWDSAAKKQQATAQLTAKGYKAQAVRR
ncbi:MAG: reverse transcriptase N-terminal domain-containing protein, partial [Bacteroidota bacterium]